MTSATTSTPRSPGCEPAATGRSLPADPVDLVRSIVLPLLVVHGEDDAYFPVEGAGDLVAAAGGQAVLWREPEGFGHAEDGFVPGWVAAVGSAVVQVSRTGRFPERGAVAP